MTWRGPYYTEVTLHCFLPELWPFVRFSHLSTDVLVSETTLSFLKGYWLTFRLLFPWPEDDHILSRSCSTDVYQSYGPFVSFSTVRLVSATPLAVFRDFSEAFQLLLPWPEEAHIIPRSRLTAFYKRYGLLSVLDIYQQKFLSPHLLLYFSRDIDETFQLLFPWPEDDHILSRSCSTDFYQLRSFGNF